MREGRPLILLAAALGLAAFLALLPVSTSLAVSQPPFDWYRYQGEADSGPKANINCEVTSVAMAIQYSRDNLRVPIAAIREYMGKEDLTSAADAQRALAHWGVPYRDVWNVPDILAALDRGHIVIAGLMMDRISPGADYERGSTPPALRFGRYYAFDGPHSVVVKGVTEDRGWFIVYDPNVWEGNPNYWYSDGTPKGKDRYYPVAEFARGLAELGDSPKGLEVLASPVREFPKQSADLAVLDYSGGPWKSVTFAFRLYNPRSEAFPLAQVGVQGRDPSGREFFAASGAVTLRPWSDEALAIPMAVGEVGSWRVYRILYFAEGLWRELPAAGFRQQMEFTVW